MMKQLITSFLFSVLSWYVWADRAHDITPGMIHDFGPQPGELEKADAEQPRRLTTGIRLALFNLRKGLYESLPMDDLAGLPFLRGITPNRIFIDIPETNRVCLFLEDQEGGLVSCRTLMRGSLGSASFYWGDPSCGVLAWHSVINDAMSVLVSPGVKQIGLHFVRTKREVDRSSVRLLKDEELFCGIPDAWEDPIDAICSDNAQRIAIKRIRDGKVNRSMPSKAVAYFVADLKGRKISGLTNWNGESWTHLYLRLDDDGNVFFVLGKNGERFLQRERGYPDEVWWKWLSPTGVDRNTISWILSPTALTSNEMTLKTAEWMRDHMIRYPFHVPQKGWGSESQIDRLFSARRNTPERWFRTMRFTRMEMTHETETLRKRIDAAPYTHSIPILYDPMEED